MSEFDDDGQPTLLNINTKEITPDWIDESQPLKLPENPLHYKAHQLQILLEKLQVQAKKNPAQFNSRNFIDTLDQYTKIIIEIKEGKTGREILDSGELDRPRTESGNEAPVGEGAPVGVDIGISANNPFAGQRV